MINTDNNKINISVEQCIYQFFISLKDGLRLTKVFG
jgi:hypothetical protein